MKRIIVFFCWLFFSMPALASNKVVIQSLNDFSVINYKSQFTAKVLEENEFDNGIILEKDSVVTGYVLETVDPKRGKRDAYIVLRPLTYTVPSKNTTERFKNENWHADVIGYKPIDPKDIAMSAGTTVGGYFIKGFGQMFYFAKGLIVPNEGENRVESAVKSVYENSPLSLVEEGQKLNIKKGDILLLRFYHSDIPKWKFRERNK